MATYFTITGPIDGEVSMLRWDEGHGFDDSPAGLAVKNAIQDRVDVHATATGPSYSAGDAPAHVALLTGLSVFDELARDIRVEGSAVEGIEETLADLVAVPDHAVA